MGTAPTAIAPPRRPPGARRTSTYRYEEPPTRRRPIWPWLLALLLVVVAGVAGWYAYGQISDSLSGSGTVSVPFVVGQKEGLAVSRVQAKGLKDHLRRLPHETVKEGFVYDQQPEPGVRVDKNTEVMIFVSTGPPKVTVPDVRGKSRDDAISTLSGRGLTFKVRDVYSKEDEGTVIAQFPTPDSRVREGSTVQINVSRGLQPVGVPSVVGQPYESAASRLQAAGFAVARRDVDSDQPKNNVVAQDPAGGASAARGATVTLSVSKGPKTSSIPDVTSQDEDTARATLEDSGFQVVVQDEDTTDPASDGLVLSQDPPGGTQAKPGTTVTIVVGRLVAVP